uniref:Uncharacterized protein n=1 Tax=Oryza rufipogon TaxID=4529 RepID=A0A0E0NJH1_ORYRU
MEERRSSAALVERRRSCRHAHKVFEKNAYKGEEEAERGGRARGGSWGLVMAANMVCGEEGRWEGVFIGCGKGGLIVDATDGARGSRTT